MKKPTIDELKAYIKEKDYPVDAEEWYDFYASKGFKIGKSPMVDWKAAVRTWARRSKNKVEPAKKESRKKLEEEHLEKYGVLPLT